MIAISPEVFRNILYSLTGLSLGAAFVAFAANLLWRKGPSLLHIGLGLLSLAWLLAVGEVFKSILVPLSAIPPTWDAWVYTVGILCGCVGFLFVTRRS